MKEIYKLHICVGLDESMVIAMQQLHPAHQMMPDKPIQCGTKIWSCVDGFGITTMLSVYSGSHGNPRDGLALDTVHQVIASLPSKGHILFADNFFGSVRSMEALMEAGQHGVLVLKQRHAKPGSSAHDKHVQYVLQEVLQQPGHAKGFSRALFHEDGYMMLGWKDKADVYFLTSVVGDTFDFSPDGVITWIQTRKERLASGMPDVHALSVKFPDVAYMYNRYKSLVDKMNDFRRLLDVPLRFSKWTQRTVMNGIVSVCIINAFWMITRVMQLKNYSIGSFLRKLAVLLIGKFTS